MARSLSLDPGIDALAVGASNQYDIDPNLTRAVLFQESGGNPNVRGGVAQILPGTLRDMMGPDADPSDPVTAIAGGVKYLAQGLAKGEAAGVADPVAYAVRYYNGGPGGPANPRTAPYLASVAGLYHRLTAQGGVVAGALPASGEAGLPQAPGTGAATRQPLPPPAVPEPPLAAIPDRPPALRSNGEPNMPLPAAAATSAFDGAGSALPPDLVRLALLGNSDVPIFPAQAGDRLAPGGALSAPDAASAVALPGLSPDLAQLSQLSAFAPGAPTNAAPGLSAPSAIAGADVAAAPSGLPPGLVRLAQLGNSDVPILPAPVADTLAPGMAPPAGAASATALPGVPADLSAPLAGAPRGGAPVARGGAPAAVPGATPASSAGGGVPGSAAPGAPVAAMSDDELLGNIESGKIPWGPSGSQGAPASPSGGQAAGASGTTAPKIDLPQPPAGSVPLDSIEGRMNRVQYFQSHGLTAQAAEDQRALDRINSTGLIPWKLPDGGVGYYAVPGYTQTQVATSAAKAQAEALAKNREQIGPGGVIGPQPGALATEAQEAQAQAKGTKEGEAPYTIVPDVVLTDPRTGVTTKRPMTMDEFRRFQAGPSATPPAAAPGTAGPSGGAPPGAGASGGAASAGIAPAGGGAATGGGSVLSGVPVAPLGFDDANKAIAEVGTQANAAQAQLATLQQLRDLALTAKPGLGWGAEAKAQIGRILTGLGATDDQVRGWLGLSPSDADAISKNSLVLSAAAVRLMGAREPGSVIGLFSRAYPNLETQPGAFDLMTNTLSQAARRLQDRRDYLVAETKRGGGGIQAYQAADAAFDRAFPAADYMHAAEAMSPGFQSRGLNGLPPDEQQAVLRLIPKGSRMAPIDGRQVRAQNGQFIPNALYIGQNGKIARRTPEGGWQPVP